MGGLLVQLKVAEEENKALQVQIAKQAEDAKKLRQKAIKHQPCLSQLSTSIAVHLFRVVTQSVDRCVLCPYMLLQVRELEQQNQEQAEDMEVEQQVVHSSSPYLPMLLPAATKVALTIDLC